MDFNKKFIHVINILITLIFYFFLVQILFFAGSSANLSLADVTWVAVIILAVLIFVYLLVNTDVFKITRNKPKAKLIASIVFFVMVIIYQIIFVYMVHPAIGFDVGVIYAAVVQPKGDVQLRGYFSQNINNLPLVLVQHWITAFFHNTSWRFINFVGLFLTDLSIVFNIITMSLIKKESVGRLIFLQSIFLMLFPWVIISYSDIWILPLVSMMLMLYTFANKLRKHFLLRLLVDVALALTVVATYYIKPSSIIPIVAIGLIEAKRIYIALFIDKSIKFKNVVTFIAIMVAMGGAGYSGFTTVKQGLAEQDYLEVFPELAIPGIHFIGMGVSGEGGYNAKDALMMALLPDKQDKIDYSKKVLIQRLKKMGPIGYLKFLVMKQGRNSADGTFAWLKEGHFFAHEPKVKNVWESFIYPQGKNLKNYQFVSQIFWLFLLFTLLFSKKQSDQWVQILRIVILGGIFYLLLFEGGRTRYLIQFLPMYLMLAAYGSENAWAFINRSFRWAKGVFDA